MRNLLPFLATLALASPALGAFSTHPAMTDPSKATEKAPETFRAKFETTKGDVIFECTREWAPNGVDRFYNLVKIGFFDDMALFRVAKGFVVQWGIHGEPKVAKAWQSANLPPDPVKQSNTRGMLSYAMAGGMNTTRSTQLFINFGNNKNLDGMGFSPICKVAEGMDIADKFYSEYGEAVTEEQGEIAAGGNEYLKKKWPNLDYIKTATIVGEAPSPERGVLSGPDQAPKSSSEQGGTDGKAAEEGSGVTPWIIGGILALAIAFVVFSRKPEEKKEPPKKKEQDGEGPKRKKKKKPAE